MERTVLYGEEWKEEEGGFDGVGDTMVGPYFGCGRCCGWLEGGGGRSLDPCTNADITHGTITY